MRSSRRPPQEKSGKPAKKDPQVGAADRARCRGDPGNRGSKRIRMATGSLPGAGTAYATAIQIQPPPSPAMGSEARPPASRSGIPPSANGESDQAGSAPPSEARIRRHAGTRTPPSSMPTQSCWPARSVSRRSHRTPPEEHRTFDTESAGCAVKAARKPGTAPGPNAQALSRMPPGRTCRVSTAVAAAPVCQRAASRPGCQQSGGSSSRESGTWAPSLSRRAAPKQGPDSY